MCYGCWWFGFVFNSLNAELGRGCFFILHSDKTSEVENLSKYNVFRGPFRWILLFWFE